MIRQAEPLPPFITVWAQQIKQAKLTAPAILLLELNKPLSFVVGQFLLLGQPLLNTFLPSHFTRNTVSLFSNRVYLEHLIKELEKS